MKGQELKVEMRPDRADDTGLKQLPTHICDGAKMTPGDGVLNYSVVAPFSGHSPFWISCINGDLETQEEVKSASSTENGLEAVPLTNVYLIRVVVLGQPTGDATQLIA